MKSISLLLSNSESILVLNLASCETLLPLLNKKALDLIALSFVESPHNDVVSHSPIADPSLRPINQISTLNFFCFSL